MVSSSSSECSFFSFFFSPFFHRFHATTHFEPSYRQSLDHIIIKHIQGTTISSYLAVGDSGSYSTESNVSQTNPQSSSTSSPQKTKLTRLLFAEALHTRGGSHGGRMALVGSREGECAGGKVVDFTDGRFSARQIEMVPCGQFFFA